VISATLEASGAASVHTMFTTWPAMRQNGVRTGTAHPTMTLHPSKIRKGHLQTQGMAAWFVERGVGLFMAPPLGEGSVGRGSRTGAGSVLPQAWVFDASGIRSKLEREMLMETYGSRNLTR